MAFDHSRLVSLHIDVRRLYSLSKREAKIKNSNRIFCSTSLLEKIQPFILFIHHIWGGVFLVSLHTSARMRFLTVLQDKYSFNNQDDRSTRFLCKTSYGIDLIIKRFHEENSIMSGLFSKNNLLLCSMQGNNGLSAKTLKNFQNHLYSQSVLTFDKPPNLQCELSYICLNL